MQTQTSLWEQADLPMLQLLTHLFDTRGPFETRGIHTRQDCDLDKAAAEASMMRLYDNGYVDGTIAGGRLFMVTRITEKARQQVSGYPAARIEASVPQLDALSGQLDALLAQVAAGLLAEPGHPQASRWKAFLRSGIDVGVDLTAKTAGEVTKALAA